MSFPQERHGAFLDKDGTTRFALWAPDALRVTVKFGDGKKFDLIKGLDGWHWNNLECGAGTQYSYIIDNDLEVPDPASRAQVNDVHSPSYVVDQNYPWKSVTWHGRPWHEVIIYELHVGVFGGYKKVEEYLPNLVDLGVTAIELMPLGEFPGARNWGYDGTLPFAPESSYGTPDELKSLIDTAHDLKLMVYIDVVYNHFGPDGNYLGHYAKGFFRDDVQTPWGAAIDFRRKQVRDFFIENALMWVVDYRVDGLRFDAVHAISEKDFLIELAEKVRAAVSPSRHLHLMLENEDNNADFLEQGFDAQWNDDGHNVLHHILTSEKEGYYEDFSELPTAKLARLLGEGFIYQGQLTRKGHARGTPSGHLPPTSFILFLQNHDQVGNRAFGERLLLLAEPEDVKIAVALMLLCPMIPLLFMGEEWGSHQPFLFFTDHNKELSKLVCEGRRNEFKDFAIFTDKASLEKIPDPNAETTFIDSALNHKSHQAREHREWWDFYKDLLNLRKTELTPHLAGAVSLGADILKEGAVTAAWRLGTGDVWRIYVNFSNDDVQATPEWEISKMVFHYGVDKSKYHAGQLCAKSILVTLTPQD